ncbi:hypothetical protein [Alkalicoccus urumqiensis]|uniref:hypothetical protein n=1 Tax=Alkalicoccus urumqiensis TaxID=1548213 RepID=UPI00115C3542|nr:hypothetical protein [Alkalicoccus urumqiensis]
MCIAAGMILALYVIGDAHWEMEQAIQENDQTPYPFLKMGLAGFLFGVLVEWRKLRSVFQGEIGVGWMMAPAIALFLFCMVPSYYWLYLFGYSTGFFHNLLYNTETNIALVILSGILFTRSLRQNV